MASAVAWSMRMRDRKSSPAVGGQQRRQSGGNAPIRGRRAIVSRDCAVGSIPHPSSQHTAPHSLNRSLQHAFSRLLQHCCFPHHCHRHVRVASCTAINVFTHEPIRSVDGRSWAAKFADVSCGRSLSSSRLHPLLTFAFVHTQCKSPDPFGTRKLNHCRPC
jgi:hypothetical protein